MSASPGLFRNAYSWVEIEQALAGRSGVALEVAGGGHPFGLSGYHENPLS
jgi:hypothetical protein